MGVCQLDGMKLKSVVDKEQVDYFSMTRHLVAISACWVVKVSPQSDKNDE